MGFLLTLLTRRWLRGQRKCKHFLDGQWSALPAFPLSLPCSHVLMVIVFFLLTDRKCLPVNESFTFPLDCGVQQGACWITSSIRVDVSVDVWTFCERRRGNRRWSVFCLFLIFWPLFFCCELVGVIDPVASVTRLSLSNLFCFFLALYQDSMLVFDTCRCIFAGGSAEQPVDKR